MFCSHRKHFNECLHRDITFVSLRAMANFMCQCRGTWLTQSEENAAVDLGVMGSSSMMGVEIS